MSLSAELTRPVIGIGAPVKAYLPDACGRLGSDPTVPEHSEVANAVGAVVGRIALKTKAVVSPEMFGFDVHTPLDCRRFSNLERAEKYALMQVRKILQQRVSEEYEGLKFRFDIRTDRHMASSKEGELLVESVVTGTAVCASVPVRSQ